MRKWIRAKVLLLLVGSVFVIAACQSTENDINDPNAPINGDPNENNETNDPLNDDDDGEADDSFNNNTEEENDPLNDDNGENNEEDNDPFGDNKDRKSTRLNSSHVAISYA